jgi:uncharacterized repeat protein (TIGR02543 family)
MKNLRKSLFVFALVAFVAVLFTACKTKDKPDVGGEEEVDPPIVESTKRTIKWNENVSGIQSFSVTTAGEDADNEGEYEMGTVFTVTYNVATATHTGFVYLADTGVELLSGATVTLDRDIYIVVTSSERKVIKVVAGITGSPILEQAGDTLNCSAFVYENNAPNTVTWSIRDIDEQGNELATQNVASIFATDGQNAVITALSNGTARVTAESTFTNLNGQKVKDTFTITVAEIFLNLDADLIELILGKSEDLTANISNSGYIVWATSSSSIASIVSTDNSKITITGEKVGGCIITATYSYTKNNQTYTKTDACAVNVTALVVDFDLNFENAPSVPSSLVGKNGKAIAPSNESIYREGFNFIGWFDAPNGVVKIDFSTKTFTQNTTVYARWESILPPPTTNIYVTFDLNYTNAPIIPQLAGIDGKVNPIGQDVIQVIRPGYTILGWTETINGTVNIDFSTKVFTESTTVYARW